MWRLSTFWFRFSFLHVSFAVVSSRVSRRDASTILCIDAEAEAEDRIGAGCCAVVWLSRSNLAHVLVDAAWISRPSVETSPLFLLCRPLAESCAEGNAVIPLRFLLQFLSRSARFRCATSSTSSLLLRLPAASWRQRSVSVAAVLSEALVLLRYRVFGVRDSLI